MPASLIIENYYDCERSAGYSDAEMPFSPLLPSFSSYLSPSHIAFLLGRRLGEFEA